MRGVVKPIVVGPRGAFLRASAAPQEFFRVKVKAGLCGTCGAPRDGAFACQCSSCAERHRVEMRVKR